MSVPKYVSNTRACSSCPFRLDGEGAFPPDRLDASIGNNLRTGYAHNCHKTNDKDHAKVCAGFVAFVEREKISNRMVQLAQRLGILAPVDTPTRFIPGKWSDVLAEHARRLRGL